MSVAWQRSIQRIIQTIIILLVLYYTMLGGFFVGVHEAYWRTVTYVISAILLGGWLIRRLLHRKAWPRTRLDWPLLAVVVTTFAATIVSTDPRLSLDSFLMITIYGLCFYFAIDLTSHQALAEKIINAILITALVICLVAIFEYWQWYYGDWLNEVNLRETGVAWSLGYSRRIKSVLHNPNVLAYYLLFVLGLLLHKFGKSSSWRVRFGWGICLLFVLLIAFLTQSRGGLLGTVVLFVSFFGMLLLTAKNPLFSLRSWRQKVPLYLIAMINLGGMILLLLWPFIFRSVGVAEYQWGQRHDIWRIALSAIAAYPWLGSGPGTFGQQYLRFREPTSDFIHSHAHNLWLTITAENGFIGLVAVLWLSLTFILITVVRLLRSPTGPLHYNPTIAMLAALSGVAVHNLFDDFLDYPMLTLHVIFLVALVLAADVEPEPAKKFSLSRSHNLPNGLAIVLLVVIGGVAFWFQPAFHAYEAARTAAQTNDWALARQYLTQAVTSDPERRFYRQQLALTSGKLIPPEKPLLSEAIAVQTDLLKQSDHYPLDYANLACLHWQAGNFSEAIQAMAQAAAREPTSGNQGEFRLVSQLAYKFSLVQFYEQMGQIEAADSLLLELLNEQPWIAASPFFEGRSERLRRIVDHISVADTTNPSALADLHYYAGNYQRAISITKMLFNQEDEVTSAIRLGQALAAIGEIEPALITIDQALIANPNHSALRLARAQVMIRQNNLDAAEIDMRFVIAQSNSPEAYTIWGVLAERQGDLTQAEQRYKRAIALATALQTNYAHLVARREPLPEETLDCVVAPYQEQQLNQPALSLGRLLEIRGEPAESYQVYQLLLRYEPYNGRAKQHLERLKNRLLN